MARTPLVVVTGYLGAGKTTLLRHVLAEARQRLAIIMNEFGDVGIDGKVIQGKHVQMVELSGGCVCCSLIGEFQAAVREVIATVQPELILVETTGVAEPDALVGDVEASLPEVRLESVATVVDVDGMIRFPSLGHTGQVQIEMGDVLVLNKTDLVSAEQVRSVEGRLRELNGRAVLWRTVRGQVPLALLFGAHQPVGLREAHPEHLAELEHVIVRENRAMVRERVDGYLATLPPEVYRMKGFVRLEDGIHLVNYVAGRWEYEAMAGEATQLVLIGRSIRQYEERLRAGLAACAAG